MFEQNWLRGLLCFVGLCGIHRNTRFAVAGINQTATATNKLGVILTKHRAMMNFHVGPP